MVRTRDEETSGVGVNANTMMNERLGPPVSWISCYEEVG